MIIVRELHDTAKATNDYSLVLEKYISWGNKLFTMLEGERAE